MFMRFRVFPVAALLLVGVGSALQAQTTIQVTPAAVSLSAQVGSTATVSTTFGVSSNAPAGSPVNFIAQVTSGSWLSVSPLSGNVSSSTSATVTVSANPSGLQAGTYTGSIQISSTASVNPQQSVQVTFTVGQVSVAPAALTFSYQSGGAVPAQQALLASGSAGVGFTAAASTSSGGNWLLIAPTSGATLPAALGASLNPAEGVLGSLAPGTYYGTITITPTSGNTTPATVAVTLTVTALPALTVKPAALTFYYQTGGSNNQQQQSFDLSSNGSPISYTLTYGVDPNPAGANWLTVTSLSGVTPATVTVGISPGSLPAGTYHGSITISTPGATPASTSVPVTLTVSSSPLLTLTPTALAYSYQIGGAAPAAQTIATGSTGTALAYTTAVAMENGTGWLSATASGTTPNPITVTVDPSQLVTGTYTGTITISAASAGNPTQQIGVTLTVSNDALLTPAPQRLTFNYQVGQAAPGGQLLTLASSTGVPLSYSATATTESGGNWLAINGNTTASGSTDGGGTLAVTVNTAGLATGKYQGTIQVSASNSLTGQAVPNTPLSIPITLYVSNNALLNVGQYDLSFTSISGALPAAQSVSLTSTSPTGPLNFTTTASTANGGQWLVVPPSGVTPNNLQVNVSPALLSAGTYNGTISIAATNPATSAATDNSPQVVNVRLTVAAGTLAASPASLTFTQAANGAAPANQAISVTSSGDVLNFSAAASTTAGGSWLSVSPSSGATPGSLTVAVNGATLSTGTYHGSILIQSAGAAGSVTVPVTLNMTEAQTLAASPMSLSFTYQVGAEAPAAKAVQVTSSGSAIPFTAAAATASGGDWLKITPASGNTPGSVSVTVDPASLAVGTYTGTITLASSGAGNSPKVSVSLVVQSTPQPGSVQVVNGASGVPGALAAGEIVYIGGTNLGPATGVAATVTNNSLPNTLGNVQVTFDGIPAPLLYVSNMQINAIVPFGVAGRATTNVQVVYNGISSGNISYRVADSAPGIFTLNQSGTGPGAILNQDYSVNSASKPAAKGSVVILYATGQGAGSPAYPDGALTPADGSGLSYPLTQPVTVTVGGRAAQVLYAGSAPGFVAGALQVNVQLPADVASGNQPVVLTVGGASSQANVTLAVQ